MRNILDKIVEVIKSHFFVPQIFPPENRAVYEIMYKNKEEPDRSQMTIYYGACALHPC
jgi:hypothetical protein